MFGLDDLIIGSIVASGVSSLANTGLSFMNFQHQKDLQDKMFNREDNSIARRVADLKSSGMSPVLAAGQGANAGQIVSTKAPEVDTQMISAMQGLLTMQKDFAVKDEQIKLLQSQRSLNYINQKIKDLDYYYYYKTGVSPNSSAFGKAFRDMLSIYSKIKGEYKETPKPEVKRFNSKEYEKLTPKQKADYNKALEAEQKYLLEQSNKSMFRTLFDKIIN